MLGLTPTMPEPLISVIIPVYQVEKYLPRCLDSVIQNTYRNLEILCVDDCSRDGCPEILRAYAARDPRIRILRKEKNEGLPAARNTGMAAATGEFIAHVDSDDWVHCRYFETLVRAWQKHGCDADLIACNFHWTAEDMLPDGAVSPDKSVSGGWDLLRGHYLFGTFLWGRLYSRELALGVDVPLEISMYEDQMRNLLTLCRRQEIKAVYVDEKLYYYYKRGDSITYQSAWDAGWKYLQYAFRAVQAMPSENGRRFGWERVFKFALNDRDLYRQQPRPREKRNYTPYFRVSLRGLLDLNFSRKRCLYYFLQWKIPALYSRSQRAAQKKREAGNV